MVPPRLRPPPSDPRRPWDADGAPLVERSRGSCSWPTSGCCGSSETWLGWMMAGSRLRQVYACWSRC